MAYVEQMHIVNIHTMNVHTHIKLRKYTHEHIHSKAMKIYTLVIHGAAK